MKKIIYQKELHPDILISIDGIGLTMMKLQEYEKAIKYQKKTLQLWEELKENKRNNQNYAISLNNLSQTLKRKGELDKAFFLMKISYEILKSIMSDQNQTVQNAKFNFHLTKTEALKRHGNILNVVNSLIEGLEKEDLNFFYLKGSVNLPEFADKLLIDTTGSTLNSQE